MPRQEKVKRSEVVPITEVQQHEINIAKQRLATAKVQASAASQTLNASKESQKLAKKMLFNADKNLMLSQNQYDLSQKELHDAEKMLQNAEKRYAAVTVDVEDTTSLQLDNLANAAAEEDKSLQLEGHVDNNNLANIAAEEYSNKKRKADIVSSSSNNQQVDAMQTLSADSKQESKKKRKAPSLHTADQKQEGVNKKTKTVTTASGEWTNTEHKQFKEGIIKYGWGCWKEMADTIITTRDRQQVKSHAQKLKKNHPDVVANLIREHECSSHTTIKKEKKKKKKTPQRSNRQGSTSSSAKAKARVPVVHHHQITPPTTIVSASKLLSNAIIKVENDINGQGNDKSVAAAAAAACDELGPLF